MNENQFTKTSSGSFMIDKDLIMYTSEKNNATFSSLSYPTIYITIIIILIGSLYNYQGHSGEYGNAAKLVAKMSKSVMWLISIHF